MILNPTHEITLSGLPSEILDAYVRYKKGSRAIVTWLIQYGSSKYEGARTLPIKELAALAQRVSSNITQVPDVIHFHFKETIAARRCLSRFFRTNVDVSAEEIDTVNHEHFTNSLCEIYDDLCERCRAASAERTARRVAQRSGTISQAVQNHYACLPIEEVNSVAEWLNESNVECDECKETVESVCHGQQNETLIEDDNMSTAIETIILLESVREVCEATAACWSKAARQEVSFIAAASVTNITWRSLRDIELKIKEFNPDNTLTSLHHYTCLLSKRSTITCPSVQTSVQHHLLTDLANSERSIKHYLDGHKLRTIPSCASCIQKPMEYIQLPQNPIPDEKKSFQMAILDNIIHLIYQAGSVPELVFKCTPCFTEINNLITRPKDDNQLFQCVLAMHLLTVSYVAYLEALPIPSNISLCRISALKLAKQGGSSIAAVLANKQAFPCQCPQTLAYHLSNLQYDLEKYVKHKCWDLYFQSPWVAGNHMMEMLDMLSYYGMRLFHYRHYAGAILHSYNVMEQLAGLNRIPVLEELCHTFRDILFPGGNRPTSSFRNSWARFVGARLKFRNGRKGHNHRESWCMAVPAHEARTAAGLSSDQARDSADPKFDYGRIDLLVRLKQQDYRINETDLTCYGSANEQGSALSTTSPSPLQPPFSSQASPAACPAPASPQSTDLTFLSTLHILDTSLQHTSLNLLSIFTTCLNITTQITLRTHTQPSPSSPSPVESNSNPGSDHPPCICFTTTLLNGADRIINARNIGKIECWSREEKNVIEVIKDVINKEFTEGKAGEKWRWDL